MRNVRNALQGRRGNEKISSSTVSKKKDVCSWVPQRRGSVEVLFDVSILNQNTPENKYQVNDILQP